MHLTRFALLTMSKNSAEAPLSESRSGHRPQKSPMSHICSPFGMCLLMLSISWKGRNEKSIWKSKVITLNEDQRVALQHFAHKAVCWRSFAAARGCCSFWIILRMNPITPSYLSSYSCTARLNRFYAQSTNGFPTKVANDLFFEKLSSTRTTTLPMYFQIVVT